MKSHDIREVLAGVFFDIPEECWTPPEHSREYPPARIWHEHRLSGVSEVEEAEDVWIQEGSWPELSERGRYFLRVRIENAVRFVTSEEAPDTSEVSVGILDGGIVGRRAISRLVSKLWTVSMAQEWEDEAVRYHSPRRVYISRPTRGQK